VIGKILYINYETTPSGATVHRDRLYESLKALGVEVTLLSKPWKKTSRIQDPASGFDAVKSWLYLKHTDWAFVLMLGRNLLREVWAFLRLRPRILLLNFTMYLSSVPLARLFGVPVILQIHAPPALHSQYAGVPVRWKNFWQIVEQRVLSLADGILVVSRTLRDYYIARGVPEAKLIVVPNGVDLSRFRPDIGPNRVVTRYRLQGMTVLGYVGILDRWVEIDRLIDMVPRLAAAHKNLKVLIVGDGPLREELQAMVSRLRLEERVILTGFVPHEEIPEHIAAMDVALTPYRRVEVFYNSSMKLVEYMAMGRAIVAPRMGEIPDLIKDGENGLLYSPDDHDEMAQKILALLKSPALRTILGLRAAQSIASLQWTWEANAREVLRAITAQIDRRRAIWLWP
jgi:glycosyltransferase involved in cell wall biosynthesis